jgi:hypothetical protein
MKGELRYWELSMGGDTGTIFLDASSATATATGLQCGLIEARSTCAFSVLAGWDNLINTAVNFYVDNGLSGITVEAGLIFPGYGRYFTDIAITSGQIAYIQKRSD